jgi:hypothetical protein
VRHQIFRDQIPELELEKRNGIHGGEERKAYTLSIHHERHFMLHVRTTRQPRSARAALLRKVQATPASRGPAQLRCTRLRSASGCRRSLHPRVAGRWLQASNWHSFAVLAKSSRLDVEDHPHTVLPRSNRPPPVANGAYPRLWIRPLYIPAAVVTGRAHRVSTPENLQMLSISLELNHRTKADGTVYTRGGRCHRCFASEINDVHRDDVYATML